MSETPNPSFQLKIQTPARIHLGLLEICPREPNRFGGLGLMVQSHGFQIQLRGSKSHSISGNLVSSVSSSCGPWEEKIEQSIERFVGEFGGGSTHGEWLLHQAPAAHHGLGSGTQLACALATLLHCQKQEALRRNHSSKRSALEVWESDTHRSIDTSIEPLSPSHRGSPEERLQRATGRGERSHIGLTGFLRGGWIYDCGHDAEGHSQTRILHTISNWPILIVIPKVNQTVHGSTELEYFRECQEQPNPNRHRMIELIEHSIAPAFQAGDWRCASDAIYEYGRLAGRVFSRVQHGDFRCREVQDTIEWMVSLGVPGVGQSSWGPTVFGLASDEDQAEYVLQRLRDHESIQHASITNLATSGAQIEIQDQ